MSMEERLQKLFDADQMLSLPEARYWRRLIHPDHTSGHVTVEESYDDEISHLEAALMQYASPEHYYTTYDTDKVAELAQRLDMEPDIAAMALSGLQQKLSEKMIEHPLLGMFTLNTGELFAVEKNNDVLKNSNSAKEFWNPN